MDDRYFFHHIRRTSGKFDKNIDEFAELEAAKKAFRTFLGSYGFGYRQDTDYVSAVITDKTGEVIKPYDDTWIKGIPVHKFFMHRIKIERGEEGEELLTRGIEVHDSLDQAKQSFNAYLGMWAYGREGVELVDCRITGDRGTIFYDETWTAPEPEPEPEPDPEPEEESR